MSFPHYSNVCDEYHGLVRDFGGSPDKMARPTIVVLCGSTRFYDEFQAANYDLTMDGKIVLSVGFYPHSKAEHGHGEGVGHDSTEKVALDELHKRKIDLADEVFVLNVATADHPLGYLGESTRSEIEYAESIGKTVSYLLHMGGWPTRPLQAPDPESAWFPTCTTPDGCENGPDIVTPNGPLCVKHAAEVSA